MRLAIPALFFLLAMAHAATNYFYGTVYRDSCRAVDIIQWTNCPPAVIVQTSKDLTNWTDRMVLSFVGPTNKTYCFEWPETNITHGAQFTRLREVQPFQVPVR